MITDLPFILSIAGLSASLAGLAGLVGGLRRGEGLRPIDRYRLREIVEFSFANALLALSLVPLTNLFGEVTTPIRLIALAALVYIVANAIVLFRRLHLARIVTTSTWVLVASVVDIVIVVAALATIATGAVAALEVLLLLLLARPMTAFLFVLVSFDTPDGPPPA